MAGQHRSSHGLRPPFRGRDIYRNFALDTTGYDGGQYYVFVKTDSNWAQQESNDDNNVSPAMPLHLVAPATKPDLTVSNLTITPNVGAIRHGLADHHLRCAQHRPDQFNDRRLLGMTSSGSPAPALLIAPPPSGPTPFGTTPLLSGPVEVFTNTATIPFPTNIGSGNFYVFVEADAFNWQQESNGNNNLTTQNNVALTLHGANFNATSATLDNGSGDINNHDVPFGTPFNLNWHVNNIGDLNTPADWIDAIYISDLWYLDDTAIKIGEISSAAMGLTTPIAPGSGYDAGMSVTIPTWMGAGYKKLFVVSGIRSTGDGSYNNIQYQPDPDNYNNSYGAIEAHLTLADIEVTSTKSYASTVNIGDTVKVDWGVTNNGDASVPPGWVDSVYISSFPTFSKQTSRQLVSFPLNFTMGSGDSSYGTGLDIDTTGLDGGQYYLFVVTDTDNTVAETIESNNVSAAIPLTLIAPAGLPDLTAGIVSVTPDPAIGDIGVSQLEVQYAIQNNSTNSTNGSGWFDRIWLSPTPVFNPATAVSLGNFWNDAPTLDPGNAFTNTVSVNLPAGVGFGTFHLFVQADCEKTQPESNGANNFSASIPVILNGSDLVVSGVTFNNYNGDASNRQLVTNNVFELGWTVENKGNVDSANYWMDAIYISDSPVWNPASATLVVAFDPNGDLPMAPSDIYQTLRQFSLPGWISSGMHFLYIVTGVDPGDETLSFSSGNTNALIKFVPDASYSSNVSEPIRIFVSKPNVDLTVAIDNAPTTVAVGQYMADSIDWTVSNIGPDVANGLANSVANYSWSDALYITQNPDDPLSYILLTTYDTTSNGNTPLWGNSSYSASVNGFNIPSGLASGDWFFVLVADNGNNQGESNDLNNTAIFPVQVVGPDLTANNVVATPIAGPVGQNSINVSWTVHNGGDVDAVGGWFDLVYISSSPVLDNTAMQLTGFHSVSDLTPDQEYTSSIDLTLPAGLGAGLYYIFVVADGYNYLAETNENNNFSDPFAINIGIQPPQEINGSDAADTLVLRKSVSGARHRSLLQYADLRRPDMGLWASQFHRLQRPGR